jgi:hypothetical protein
MVVYFEHIVGEGRGAVFGSLTKTPGGLVAQFYGGSFEHVGSVVLSIPVAPEGKLPITTPTSSVLNLPSHKDEAVARPAAERLAATSGLPTVCIAGLHIDNATSDEIEILMKNTQDCVDKLIQTLKTTERR